MKTRTLLILGLVAVLLGLALAAPLAAQAIPTTDRGYYDATGAHDPTSTGYRAGNALIGSTYRRNFFTFDLSGIDESVTAATLMVWNRSTTWDSVDSSETYVVYDVATPLPDLLAGTGGLACYDDLGTGTTFGSYILTALDVESEILIPLNAAGLAAVNGAIGGDFALGGAFTTLDADPATEENAFADTVGSGGAAQLILQTSAQAVDALDRGWYEIGGQHLPENENYIVGNCPSCPISDYFRNFFVFDVGGVDALVAGATLAVERRTYYGHLAGETYDVFDITTPLGALLGGTGGLAAYADLGAGLSYGSYDILIPGTPALLEVPLNATALTALNEAGGLPFAVGGALTSLDGDPATAEQLFGGTGGAPNVTQLVLDVEVQWTYLGAGLAGTGGRVPLLTATGDMLGGDLVTLRLDNALPGADAYFVLGVALLAAPFKFGVMYPSPDLILGPLTVGPAGTIEFGFSWPTGIPSDASLYYQYWIQDPGGIVGFAASNGLQSTTP